MKTVISHYLNFHSSGAEKANKWLHNAAAAWLIGAVLGQLIFAYYIASFYGTHALNNDFEKWNEILPHGYQKGKIFDNTIMLLHLLFAAIIMISAPFQFSPFIRSRFRTFHRWNGRLYVFAAFLLSIGGVVIVLRKGTVTGLVGDIGISINALLIMIFAFFAVMRARQKQFKEHSRWALRLYLAVCGVWFFRILLMLWLMAFGPLGIDLEYFRGPLISILGFAQYLLPLSILEFYFSSRQSERSGPKLIMIAALLFCTLVTLGGIFAASTGMWIPRLASLSY